MTEKDKTRVFQGDVSVLTSPQIWAADDSWRKIKKDSFGYKYLTNGVTLSVMIVWLQPRFVGLFFLAAQLYIPNKHCASTFVGC